jgi:predicted transcriptional regulator
VRRQNRPSDCAQLVRGVRLHCGIEQQGLARAVGKTKVWLAKRELGAVHMNSAEARDLVLAILTMNAAETVEKNKAKQAILQESDKEPRSQVTEESAG